MFIQSSNKYHAKKTLVGSDCFDSALEARFWTHYVRPLQQAGAAVERQKRFDLTVNGEKVSEYCADFVITERGKTPYVLECKGMFVGDAKMKLHLFEALYHIPVFIGYSLQRIERLPGYRKRTKTGNGPKSLA